MRQVSCRAAKLVRRPDEIDGYGNATRDDENGLTLRFMVSTLGVNAM